MLREVKCLFQSHTASKRQCLEQPRSLPLSAKVCLKFSVHLEGETDKEMNYYPTVREECCWMNSICFRNANPHAKRILIKPRFQLDRSVLQREPRAWDQRCLLTLVSRLYHSVPNPHGASQSNWQHPADTGPLNSSALSLSQETPRCEH